MYREYFLITFSTTHSHEEVAECLPPHKLFKASGTTATSYLLTPSTD